MLTNVFMVLFVLVGVVLILAVLIQKGRGGGLAGAFGGPGGHSAFGTKTADIFIKGTAVLAAIFLLLAVATAKFMKPAEPESIVPETTQGEPADEEPDDGAGTEADEATDE